MGLKEEEQRLNCSSA